MRVKRLEVQGFKSFKDKTVIHFDHAITGIVGPNGCGKSNIVDAFFWVMGEQSYKHMRGASSEDLIFNGSSKYAPLGFAEATLVMEMEPAGSDADLPAAGASVNAHLKGGKDISVTRRVYRSGEGEYFINGVPARLKDIQELFMDTGVGAKGYSVIEQGQIGKIVNAKPEERRLLIEEAAGIAKYKARKKESLRKMEATQTNLSRLNDVIAEIERNLGSLERQAQKAQQYKKYKDELLDKEMTWGRRKSQVLTMRLTDLKAKRDVLEQELAGLRAELSTAENTIEVDRIAQLTSTKIAEDLQSKIQDYASELASEKSALDLSRRRQGDLASQLSTLEGERDELQETITVDQERLAARETESQDAGYEYEAASERASTMDETTRTLRQEVEQARRKLDTDKRNLMNGIAQASDLTSRAASLMSRMESAKSQAERLSQQVSTLTEKVGSAREEAAKAQVTAQEVRESREKLAIERKEQALANEANEQGLKKLLRDKDDANRTLTQVRSKLQSLEELAEANEGFGDGPKAALDWAKESGFSDQIKAIADGLDVTAGYEAALEGYLEGRLEDLTSENPANALGALTELRNSKQGRASIHVAPDFSCSSKAAAYSKVEATLKAAGLEVIGELSQFVKVNKKLGTVGQQTASELISHVCVVQNFEAIHSLIGSGKLEDLSGWSMVSLDGQAFDKEGTLRGGAASSNPGASILGRKRAIAELQDQVAIAEAQYSQVEAAAQDAQQHLDVSRARMQMLQSELQSLEVQGAALDRDVHQMNRALKDAENQLELTQMEMTEAEETAQTATRERMEIDDKLNTIISSRSDLESQIQEAEDVLSAREAEVREQETELNALKVNEASLRERSSSLRREMEQGQRVLADRQRRLTEVTRTLDRVSGERGQHSGGDSGAEEKIAELTRTLGDARASLAQVKDQLEKTSTTLNGALERIKKLHHVGDGKTAESNHLSLEVEKLNSDLAHLTQNLEEKYGAGCLENPVTSHIQEEMPNPVVTTEMSAEEERLLGEDVERLRERIRRLGEVNVGAIDEFEALKKRHDYLLTEKTDLEHSIRNLEEAIEHINKTSEDRFARAFEAIADRFERLFPIIFGGGQAKLSLVYPEGSTDILEAGVDILAQPPGKKVVNITLLSGGEKALTAVSLIFAIFMVKPSPFCVLDEVDAPLDDANIGKFNALLREMSAKSQFILITHNKKTMELNDTLYGVTMEEPGVSKMVSIEMH
ncbi:MAG: chromosome segregation protein SMC [Methylotenera sp.]|nr:chromosome segregation protein SMC [Oligoflexia bacterium]